ncbi:radical SAM domain-containing protein [Gottschalkia acidurici 9a]|uniref:Radical SAM domain-containing protein n=1 Tax=Gottschalkia acidurici (strain ATCC 7906 / DSM 604 / BCRC 14475 / CIP 104303 / KCTC 5404 / NCIMB 10678 / 9a) TaxID=1128398 RepID=K0AXC5_GOTA9|nr:radical SAM protein [Gottschalkia acidurici]AFS77854.1 radical SAM domain-containing protein [Gottschalkia acidurici 9a]
MLNKRYFSYDFDNKYFLYDSDTGLVFTSTETMNRVVELINLKYGKQNIIDSLYRLDKNEVENSINFLKQLSKQYNLREGQNKDLVRKNKNIEESLWLDGQVLSKMWLSISYSCNMKCTYCFADSGTYGNESMMTIETAKKCIDYFFKYVNKKANRFNVQYFGGEPLLNKEVFIFATEYINQKSSELGLKPNYIITTNGTIMDNDILDVIISNRMYVHISIDGSKDIHNLNRKFSSGEETFGIVANNINMIKERGYRNIGARVTLTKPGIKSLKEDVKFLWDFGFNHVFIDIVKTDIKELAIDKDSICLLKQELEEIMIMMKEELLNGNMKCIRNITDMESIIKNRTIKAECTYFNPFTIKFTPKGEIYKCEFALNEKENYVGSISKGIEWDKFKKTFTPEERCLNCWAKRLCGGGCHLYSNDDVSCEYSKIIMENALKYYSFFESNEERAL